MPPSGSSDVANECRPLGSIPSGLFRPLDWTNSFTNSVNFLRLWARRDIALCCCCAESTQCAPEQITKTMTPENKIAKKWQEKRTHVREPTKCLSKLLLLWLQFFKPCPHLWYWKLFSKCLVLASGRGKNKKYSKTKNHWPDLMVSSLHDYWKVLWSYSDCVKTGRAQFHWTLNWKTWNERLEFPQLAVRWP